MTNIESSVTAQRNKSNFLQSKAAFNRNAIVSCVSFSATDHQIMSKPSPKRRQAIRACFEESHQTWPDIQIVVEHAVAEDNWVMGRSLTTATHTQAIFDVMATHKRVETTFWDLHPAVTLPSNASVYPSAIEYVFRGQDHADIPKLTRFDLGRIDHSRLIERYA